MSKVRWEGLDPEQLAALAGRSNLDWLRNCQYSVPKPGNDAELEVLTKLLFGLTLSVSIELGEYTTEAGSRVPMRGKFEINQPYESYRERFELLPVVSAFEKIDDPLWTRVFGAIHSGGSSNRRYGHFNINGHRNRLRLEYWRLVKGTKLNSALRRPFVRLAQLVGERESGRDLSKSFLFSRIP
jgi:hypothetical protein